MVAILGRIVSDNFEGALKSLLRLTAPKKGAAALLFRHPVGPVYFPLAAYVSPDLPASHGDPLAHYYLFSTRLGEDDIANRVVMLSADSNAQELVRHGKLAVHLFERESLRVQLFPFDSDAQNPIVLSVISPSADSYQGPQQDAFNATVCVAREWINTNERLLPIRGNTEGDVLASAREMLEDRRPTPPWFPVLHAELATTNTRPEERVLGSNPLSYNCALWSIYETLRADYIDDMFRRAVKSDACFLHPIPEGKNVDTLAKAVATVCDDWVCKIAVAKGTEAILCARYNVPKRLAREAQEKWGKFHECAEADSDWKLVQIGLSTLFSGDELSALITMWIGHPGDDKRSAFALPLGFMPGGQQRCLTEVAGAQVLAARCSEYSGKHVTLRVVRLAEDMRSYSQPTDTLIRRLVHDIDGRIGEANTTLPPPFILDFMHGAGLAISSDNNKQARLNVLKPEIRAFFLALYGVRKEDLPILSHDGVLNICREMNVRGVSSKQDAGKRVGEWRKMLIRHRLCPILKEHLDQLFRNEGRKGWVLDETVEVVGLPRDFLQGALTGFARTHEKSYDPSEIASEKIDGTSVTR